MTNTANGKCCLALLEAERARALVRKALRSTKRLNAILAEIAEVRRTGIGFNHEEHTVGISAVGMGFRDAAGGIYAISIPVPTSRFLVVKDDMIISPKTHFKTLIERLAQVTKI